MRCARTAIFTAGPLKRVAEPIKFQRKMPSLEQLKANYDEKDQTTIIYDKRVKVTHPISIFGMQKPNF